MKLWLVRHGRPDFDDRIPIRGSDFARWVAGYDEAPLDGSVSPSEELCELAISAGCIATSTLRRSIESAGVLDSARSFVSEPHFREAEIPGIPIALAWGPQRWAKLARVVWYFGWSPGVESLSDALARARAGAQQLDLLATRHGSVMLVAHGMINGYIGWALRQYGWRGPSAFGGRYWAHYEYEKRA